MKIYELATAQMGFSLAFYPFRQALLVHPSDFLMLAVPSDPAKKIQIVLLK